MSLEQREQAGRVYVMLLEKDNHQLTRKITFKFLMNEWALWTLVQERVNVSFEGGCRLSREH